MFFGVENIIFITLFTGVVTAFLPCTFPIILAYFGLLSGTTKSKESRHFIIFRTLSFFLGFGLIYALLGSVAGWFGEFSATTLFLTADLRGVIIFLGGVLFIILGLVLLRAIPLPSKLKGLYSIKLPMWARKDSVWTAFVVGIIFAAGWSPCISPVLGGILVLAAASNTVWIGGALLFLFAVGVAIPFIILSLFYVSIIQKVKNLEKITHIASLISGAIFIFLGILFLTDNIGFLTSISENAFLYSLLE